MARRIARRAERRLRSAEPPKKRQLSDRTLSRKTGANDKERRESCWLRHLHSGKFMALVAQEPGLAVPAVALRTFWRFNMTVVRINVFVVRALGKRLVRAAVALQTLILLHGLHGLRHVTHVAL